MEIGFKAKAKKSDDFKFLTNGGASRIKRIIKLGNKSITPFVNVFITISALNNRIINDIDAIYKRLGKLLKSINK